MQDITHNVGQPIGYNNANGISILCFGQGCHEIVVCIQNVLVVYTHFTIEHFISNQIFMFAKLILNFPNTKCPSNMF
jgi:hypothetical protein